MKNLIVTCRKESYYIRLAAIICLLADGRYTKIITTEKNYFFCRNLAQFEKELPGYFMRIHHSHIVNLSNITHLKDRRVYMNNGQALTISHRKYSRTTKSINSFFRNSTMD